MVDLLQPARAQEEAYQRILIDAANVQIHVGHAFTLYAQMDFPSALAQIDLAKHFLKYMEEKVRDAEQLWHNVQDESLPTEPSSE